MMIHLHRQRVSFKDSKTQKLVPFHFPSVHSLILNPETSRLAGKNIRSKKNQFQYM